MINTIKLTAIFLAGIGMGLLLWTWKGDFQSSSAVMNQIDGEDEMMSASAAEVSRWNTKQGVMEISSESLDDDEIVMDWKTRYASSQGVMEISEFDRVKDVCCEQEMLLNSSLEGETLPQILKRWGTCEGVIEYARSTDQHIRRSSVMMCRERKLANKTIQDFYLRLNQNFEVTQFSVANNSDTNRSITLSDSGLVSEPSDDNVDSRVTFYTGVHPQGVLINPYNDLMYVTNQLSDSVTIADEAGTVLQTISLQSGNLPGQTSPVALTVSAQAGTPHYGKVYVAGSVANTVTVIDTTGLIENVIEVGVRPVAIAFHSENQKIYVANFVSHTVSVINANAGVVEATLLVGINPRSISINPVNGDIYVANTGENSITVFDKLHNLLATILSAGDEPISLSWHPGVNKMFVVAQGSAQLYAVNASTYVLDPPIALPGVPGSLVYNSFNDLLYISDKANGQLITISALSGQLNTIPAEGVNIGLSSHPVQNKVLWSMTRYNTATTLRYVPGSTAIVYDAQELKRIVNYFQFNPAIMEHLKIVVEGNQTLGQLRMTKKSITGLKQSLSISLSSHRSVDHMQHVYEVNELKGIALQHLSFGIDLPAHHALIFLLYYQPLEREKILTSTTNNFKNVVLCQN